MKRSTMSSDYRVSTSCYLFLFLHLTLVPISSGERIWSWRCDSTSGFCTRLSSRLSIRDELLYPSIEVCRLICGQYGALWPRPTSKAQISSNLIKFNPGSISFQISAEGAVLQFLNENADIFRDLISREDTGSCAETTGGIAIHLTVASSSLSLNWSTNESYQLNIATENGKTAVEISAETAFGARHALETLTQLVELYEEDDGKNCLVMVDSAQISDSPVYPHRGLLLDTARNFLSINNIKKHLNAMAASKLNVLHWHITDSQSFPLDLPSEPNMTRFGAYSQDKIYHLADVKDLLSYAKLRGIRVLIELDAPSHSGNGWQWGPEAGLGNLAVCINQSPYSSFCIQPPCGQLNPINPNLYGILGNLYKDIIDVLPNGEIFHMGGDEVYIPCWNSTPEIIAYLGNTSRTTEVFLDLWAEYQGKALAAFDKASASSQTPIIIWTSHLTQIDVIEKYLPKDRYVIQTWVPSSDNLPNDLLDLGYRIVVSTKDTWYLDHGFWGSTLYHNWRVVYDNRIPRRSGTLGGEVCMWGELVDDTSVEPRVWPRAAAAAERLWSDPSTDSKAAFTRFYRHKERLVERGINAESLTPKWCYQNEGEC